MNSIDLFTKIYEENKWGGNISTDFKGNSGGGSYINETNLEHYIPFVKKFIDENKIKSVVDIGCGDFRCGELIYKDTDCIYTGYDVYEKMIESHNKKFKDNKNTCFIFTDIINNPENLQKADLCIIKDVLQHIPCSMIYKFLDYITSNKLFKYILITNTSFQTGDNQELKSKDTINCFRALSANYLPLIKYAAEILYNYGVEGDPKEICLIKL